MIQNNFDYIEQIFIYWFMLKVFKFYFIIKVFYKNNIIYVERIIYKDEKKIILMYFFII